MLCQCMRARGWGGKEVVLSEMVKGGVVVVVVYAEVRDELVVRGSELKEKRVGPGEWVWFLGAAGMGSGCHGTQHLS